MAFVFQLVLSILLFQQYIVAIIGAQSTRIPAFASIGGGMSKSKESTQIQRRKDLPEKILVAYTTNKCNDLNDMSKVGCTYV